MPRDGVANAKTIIEKVGCGLGKERPRSAYVVLR
jgi:hypothetical protein